MISITKPDHELDQDLSSDPTSVELSTEKESEIRFSDNSQKEINVGTPIFLSELSHTYFQQPWNTNLIFEVEDPLEFQFLPDDKIYADIVAQSHVESIAHPSESNLGSNH